MTTPSDVAVPDPPINTRPGLPFAAAEEGLGLLADLAGTWVGTGFTLISLPDFDSSPPSTGPAPFRLKLNATVEILELDPIGGVVPNRGSTDPTGKTGQLDIKISGLRYLQRVSDAVTNEALHIEPGLWLNVGATTVPPGRPTVVRQGTIPHGNSLLALGEPPTPVNSGPRIDPFDNPPLPPGFTLPMVKNPNLALLAAISGQNITRTVVLPISTAAPAGGPATQVGGIVNMPFDVSNANATRLDAIFWIETVEQVNGSSFLQLQYTQTVTLNFLGIDWPHISVATLVKQ
jgi:hypothetical protein